METNSKQQLQKKKEGTERKKTSLLKKGQQAKVKRLNESQSKIDAYFKVNPTHVSKGYKELVAIFSGLGVDIVERDLDVYFSPNLEEEVIDNKLIYQNLGL